MSVIYFDCFSGISGDMILGTLIGAGLPLSALQRELGKIPLKGYRISARAVTRQNIRAIKIDISASPKPIQPSVMISTIRRSRLASEIKDKIIRLIKRLAEVESRVHGIKSHISYPESKIHLHELGSIDTLIDISGAIIGLHLLGITRVYSSPLPLFRGFVQTQHGRLPLPAPATAELLKGFSVYATEINKEIVTPTGALLITSLATPVKEMPVMTVKRIAYGSGEGDLPNQPNLLRAFIGEVSPKSSTSGGRNQKSAIWVLETNLDDTAPQIIGYVFEKLLKAGAVDVFTVPIQMKKSRPGVLLRVITEEKDIPKLEEIIFSETTTFGIRHYPVARTVLEREIKTIMTKYGPVSVKTGKLKNQLVTISPEYEDCRKIAEDKHIPLKEVYQEVMKRVRI